MSNEVNLSKDELERYGRHLLLKEVGDDGQKRLKSARVLLIGVGGLGSPIAMYLAAAGVGRLGLVDHDRVDLSNLHRQILHHTDDVGILKTESAKKQLRSINPEIELSLFSEKITSQNALDIIRDFDLVVDGSDNFPTRYLINDACCLLSKPNIYGSIFRFEGQVSVFGAKDGPCYRCFFKEPPPPQAVPNCAEAGVLGVLPGVIGTIQATEAVKILLNLGEPLVGRLLLYDALEMSFRTVKIQRDPNCAVCGDRRTLHELIDYDAFCKVPSDIVEMTASELRARLKNKEEFLLLDVRNPEEYAESRIAGSKLIPIQELPARLQELRLEVDTVIYCKGGKRGEQAWQILHEKGFKRIKNLQGGILAWKNAGY